MLQKCILEIWSVWFTTRNVHVLDSPGDSVIAQNVCVLCAYCILGIPKTQKVKYSTVFCVKMTATVKVGGENTQEVIVWSFVFSLPLFLFILLRTHSSPRKKTHFLHFESAEDSVRIRQRWITPSFFPLLLNWNSNVPHLNAAKNSGALLEKLWKVAKLVTRNLLYE